MNKERIKGMVIGFVLCAVLLGGMMVVSAQTVTRNIVYGVQVRLNGELMNFAADSQPFVMEGRTFLPVRAISDVVGLPVDFDAGTNTVYLGARTVATRRPLQEAAPFFDSATNRWGELYSHTPDSVAMGGVEHSNAIVRVYGDGRLLQTLELNAGDLPQSFSVFVEDVHLLRIEFLTVGATRPGVWNNIRYALVGYLE